MSDVDRYAGDSQVPSIDSVEYSPPKDGFRYYVASVDQGNALTVIEAPSSTVAEKYARAYFGPKYKSLSNAERWQVRWVIGSGGRIHLVTEDYV